MKLYKFFMGLAAAAVSMGSVSCSDDFDRPPVITPVSDLEVNTTILQLKEQYYQTGSDYLSDIGLTADGDHIIIGGRVVSSDEEGNIYQRIIIEDETAAIPVRVYTTDLFETYHYGQEVRIDVSGLKIGTYRGWLMIGAEYNGGVGGMDKAVMEERAQVNGLPAVNEIPEYVTTIADVMAAKDNETEFMTWQSRLITLENVTFVDGGKATWGTVGANNYTTRKLRDEAGNTIDISTSNRCDFTGTTMPTGTGTVRAILSYFGSNWQLVFSNPETDCIGFTMPDDNPDNPDQPDQPGEGVTSINENFEAGAIPAGWTETTTSGNRNWQIRDFNGNHYMQCSAYKGTAGSDGFQSWLITPAVNIDGMKDKVMSFETEIQYNGESNLQLYALSTADPKSAEKVEFTFTQPNQTGTASTGYVFSGEIDLSQLKGTVYFAWLYTAKDPDASRTYRVDNVLIGIKASDKPDQPDQPSTTAKFKKATSITSGKSYVMVIDGNKIGTPIAQNLSYGRLALADVTVTGDELTTNSENGIVIKATEGGYTMTDTYGRLIAIDNNPDHSSFQVYTSMQDYGCVWTITFGAEGTATIANVSNPDIHAVRSGTFTNIAPSNVAQYKEFTEPVLYERVD